MKPCKYCNETMKVVPGLCSWEYYCKNCDQGGGELIPVIAKSKIFLREGMMVPAEDCNKCGHEGKDSHNCPFAMDIEDDYETLCNCCKDCEQDCADDI